MEGYLTKKETIYKILKEEIYEGEYELGERLVISHLAKRFNSSEIPVREALNQLTSEGLIVFKPHVGAMVSQLSPKDIQNILDMRIELEGLATRLAAEHLDTKDFEALREIIDESKRVFEDRDYKKYTNLNLEFHMIIYRKSDNDLLYKTIKDLWRNSSRYPRIFHKNDDHIRLSIEEHQEIYEALMHKNSILAENIMLKHKARAAKEILRLTQPK